MSLDQTAERDFMNNTQDPAIDETDDDIFEGGDRFAWGDDDDDE